MTLLRRTVLALMGVVLILGTCYIATESRRRHNLDEKETLGLLTTEDTKNADFERRFFSRFASQHKVRFELVPPTESVRSQLEWYERHLAGHSPKPDLYEIDVVWPAALANDLIDLTSYFPRESTEIDPGVLNNFRVGKRLVALPTLIDVGVLFYRTDLLAKYGYTNPPATWDQLTSMAARIQAGERAGNKPNFWGYVWQGGAYEGLTCNALEWQASAAGADFLDSSGFAHVDNPQMVSVLRRAASWIGSISPPGQAFFTEPDSINFWTEGNAAFMRNWISLYAAAGSRDWPPGAAFKVAPLPGGPGGRRGTLGGLGMSVSRYSGNQAMAIKALGSFVSPTVETERTLDAGFIPSHKALRGQPGIMAKTALPGKLADQVMGGLISRAVLAQGTVYPVASKAYFKAVNSVLVGASTPEQAMRDLESQLVSIRKTVVHSRELHPAASAALRSIF